MSVTDEIQKLKTDTLKGLDESCEALKMLREDCCKSAEVLLGDLVVGAAAVVDVAHSIHDFLIFEQEVVQIFGVDASTIVVGSDTLKEVEDDMHTLLASFDEKMEAMDVYGVAELFRKPVPALLQRFEAMMPELRKFVYDFINA